MPAEETVVLIAFDGSPAARRAVHYASRFLTVDRAVVLTVWSPLHRGSEPTAFDLDGPPDPPEADEADIALGEAQRTNAAGVELAVAAGLPAEPLCVAQTYTVWGTIIAVADDVDADLIVTGTRATTGLRSLVQSSVADHVRRRGHRPVLIVPPEP
ncbi:universal stress protein UspA [Mycolicibacterium chubuense]|jgi:nucleotide-binding universal stress UspA family protein|uniref:Universal stress protein family protein n=1 Tax=Mycolicibacterium chubuense TaxID=1800 RepID=A0A0J6YHQ7_MYCCU|nr:universal stress protein [Mycolicibacterium chubuense]KMO72431.1 Universal stress protein family protein [Mycolicibacterium chubuense]ORA56405.1 universal stress protein UspA [Mycolicibacterium chubuense]SPX99181.1 UspA domain-containing protein [Mycolicibacterium chubuense]